MTDDKPQFMPKWKNSTWPKLVERAVFSKCGAKHRIRSASIFIISFFFNSILTKLYFRCNNSFDADPLALVLYSYFEKESQCSTS